MFAEGRRLSELVIIRRRRSSVAFLLSLAIHLGLLLLLVLIAARTSSPPRAPIALKIVHLPAQRPPAKRHAPAPGAATVQAPPGHGYGHAAKPSAPVAQAPRGLPADAPKATGPTRGSGKGHPSLFPNLPTVAGGTDGEPPHGRTLRNDGSGPDRGAQLAEEKARVQGRVQGWTSDELASLRVEHGLPPAYFEDMKRAFETELGKGKVPVSPQELGNPMRALSAAGEEMSEQRSRYGKTGNPLAERDPDVADVEDRYSPNMQALIRDPGGQTPSGAIASALGNTEPLRQAAQKAAQNVGLRCIVELVQARDGTVRGSRVVETSGNSRFDRYVVEMAPKAAKGLGAAPPDAARSDEMRSVWEFIGSVRYDRPVSEAARDHPGATAVGTVVGLVTGLDSFDETTGTVKVPDFTAPRIEFKVRLLRLY